jgi:hypothetical protein
MQSGNVEILEEKSNADQCAQKPVRNVMRVISTEQCAFIIVKLAEALYP